MSHFYAMIPVSARKTTATARGHVTTGIETVAASWSGAIHTRMWFDQITENDCFELSMKPHHNFGDHKIIGSGIVGLANSFLPVPEYLNKHLCATVREQLRAGAAS